MTDERDYKSLKDILDDAGISKEEFWAVDLDADYVKEFGIDDYMIEFPE